ncbi:hypothetical protein FF2_031830 [Malus domestica]
MDGGSIMSNFELTVLLLIAGMQSSLLALAVANRFFQDPLAGVPPAISTLIMSLMGFSLVMVWTKKKKL